MNDEIKSMRLTDFVWFQRGFDLPQSKFEEGEVPVYGSTSILGYHNVFKVKAPGIITGRSGTLGKFQYSEIDFWPHNTTLWVKDFKGNDPKFAYYLLQCLDFTVFNSGGAVPSLNRNLLNAYVVNVPPLETQTRIASILSAYDDLIENNQRRIKILEEMAQQTYEEWFVRMRFPGYETTRFDLETGLPEGWEKARLKVFCELIMGQSPKSEFYNEDKIGLPFHQGVKDYGFRFPAHKSWSKEGNKRAKANSILFSVRAPVGRLNVAAEEIILGRGLAAINHNDGLNSFIFYQLQKIFFEDNLIGGGAIFASVTKNDMERIELIYHGDLAKKFNDFAYKIDNQILNLTKQNQRLTEARDILLPRLIMGLIKV
ncbi:restriction endonuclease subunit S [Sphingobacterium faecium]